MNARLAALAALALATGCQSFSAPDSVVNGNAVLTMYAPGTSWTRFDTFSIDPTITIVDNTGATQQTCTVAANSALVSTIQNEMEARGYTFDPILADSTDLRFTMTAYLGSQAYYYSYCGAYYYYYCYPGYAYGGSYSFGTLALDLLDLKNSLTSGTAKIVWTDATYGVLASYYQSCASNPSSINWGKISSAVSRGFDQSPYIRK